MAKQIDEKFALRITKGAWEIKDKVYAKAVKVAVDNGDPIPSKAEAYEIAFKAFINS